MSYTPFKSYFALIDANNFYASCERLFRPDLITTPIIVLSNNDGCVIARSNEAKKMGIEMGVPFHQVKHLCHKHHIHVFSSNYALYGDLSNRLMHIIADNVPTMEIYSIDEAFVELQRQEITLMHQLRGTILQHIGVPVSIGIGPTKTLAKVANHIAKRVLYQPIFEINQENIDWLKHIPIHDVWGVGRRWGQKLMALGITTAHDLAHANSEFIRKHFNVVLTRIVRELNGINCLELDAPSNKKSIVSSKSFSKALHDYDSISHALSHYCARASEKLRAQGSKANFIHVFLKTNPFSKNSPQYRNACGYRLIMPSDDTRELVTHAKHCLKIIYRQGYRYHKTGVMLSDLQSKTIQQYSLLETGKSQANPLMPLIDCINRRYGTSTIKVAAEGLHQTWRPLSLKRSPHYTTQWQDLAKASC
ncbi:MAG: DNA polymerase V, subunit C [Legionellales bacterium]|nr:DNA polymerase V, subunit C [Legionellales bacterium]OUX66421.1 MAG: hypothetical protein CBE41_00270 [Gammaproteobacteria bacterium TMED281]